MARAKEAQHRTGAPAPRGNARLTGAVVAFLLLAVACSGSSSDTGQAAGPQLISRPDLGFSMELPAAWLEDREETPGSVFYARSAPAGSWVRVFRAETAQPLEQSMVNVIDGLTKQGGQDFAQHPVEVGGLPGIRLDYRAADGPPGSGLVAHSSYRVRRDRALFSLALATRDQAAQQPVLDRIAASFRLL